MATTGTSVPATADEGPAALPVGERAGRERAARIASLLDSVVRNGHSATVLAEIVGYLRLRDYGFADLVADVAAAKRRAGLDSPSGLDELVALCVDRTALVQEAAIENMLHGFCELDASGAIVYANAALLDLIPQCKGRKLARLLGIDPETIIEEMDAPERRVHRLELQAGDHRGPVLVEFGSVGRGDGTGYCIVTDLSPAEAAQRRIDDLAEFGIFRLDAEMRITYANDVACSLLGSNPDELMGLTPGDLIRNPEDREQVRDHFARRSKGVSTEYAVEITPLNDDHPIHIRVRSMPDLDPDGQLTGMFVTLARIDAELAAKKIQEELARATGPEALFAAVVAQVRNLVPCGYATLSVYAQKGAYSRLLQSVPEMKTNQRWVALPKSVQHLIGPEFSHGDDIADFLRRDPDRKQLEANVGVRELIDAGMKSWFSLSIKTRDHHAVLTLMDAQMGIYSDSTAETLKQMGAPDAIHAVLKLYDERESHFRLALIKQMSQKRRDLDLAELVTSELAKFYGWQNVAIFKVNAIQGKFELLTQFAAERDGFELPRGYRQPLGKGFLAKAFESGEMVVVADSEDEAVADQYVRVSDLTRSEMCVPIRVEDRIVWILNIEDQRPDAFKDPDQETVKQLMLELEPSLERTLASALLDQVLEDAPDAIVITDARGNILKANDGAREMLGGEPIGASLETFFEEGSDASEAIAHVTNNTIPLEATLVGLDDRRTNVLIRTRIPRDEYGRCVILLQDRDKLEWQTQTRQLMNALEETAARVRIPLSLASTFVRQIRRSAGLDAGQIAEMADRAIEQLAQVDLSYDQVVGHALADDGAPVADVAAAVRDCIESLPPKHRTLIQAGDSDEPILAVAADSKQFDSAVKCMLAYLLRVGDPDGPITFRARSPGDLVAITLTKPLHEEYLAKAEAERCGPVLAARFPNEARALCALDEPRLDRFARKAGGSFRRRRSGDGEILRLVLPQGD